MTKAHEALEATTRADQAQALGVDRAGETMRDEERIGVEDQTSLRQRMKLRVGGSEMIAMCSAIEKRPLQLPSSVILPVSQMSPYSNYVRSH